MELTQEEKQAILAKIVAIKALDLTVTLCGSWLWISGETKAKKEDLKLIGCYYAPKKKLWYWRLEKEGQKFYKKRKTKTMDEIEEKYGKKVL